MSLPTIDASAVFSDEERMFATFARRTEGPEVYAATTEVTTVAFVCAELRKLHVTCCGMPHEDVSRNPGRGTCGNVQASYNLACVHSYAGVPVLQAYEMACRSGMIATANLLWNSFEHCQQQLDLGDSEGGVLYSLSTGKIAVESDRAESAMRRLEHLYVNTDAAKSGNLAVQQEIRTLQATLGQKMLAIRDAFLALLEPLLDAEAPSAPQSPAFVRDDEQRGAAEVRRDVPLSVRSLA